MKHQFILDEIIVHLTIQKSEIKAILIPLLYIQFLILSFFAFLFVILPNVFLSKFRDNLIMVGYRLMLLFLSHLKVNYLL